MNSYLLEETEKYYIFHDSPEKKIYLNKKQNQILWGNCTSQSSVVIARKQIQNSISDKVLLVLMVSTVLVYVNQLITCLRSFKNKEVGLIEAVCYVGISIILHELSHSVAYYHYTGKMPKLELRFLRIFPAIGVSTSLAFLCTPLQRFIIFYAGLFTNILLNQILFISGYALYTVPMIFFILFNMLPVGYLKTDGFNILFISVLKNYHFLNKKHPYNRFFKYVIYIMAVNMIIKAIRHLYEIF